MLEDNISNGESIFQGNYLASHAGGGNVVILEKGLRKDQIASNLAVSFQQSSIENIVTNGKNAMPAFEALFSKEDIQCLSIRKKQLTPAKRPVTQLRR